MELVKNHTGSAFTPEILEVWMGLPWVPDDIRQLLAKAWVRNGGWQALPRVLKRSSVFGSVAAENYSPEAKLALSYWFDPLLKFDQQIKRLRTMLNAWSDLPKETIIQAHYFNVHPFPGPMEVWVKTKLEKYYPETDARMIFNHILDIVMEWNKRTPDGRGRYIEGRRIIPFVRVSGQTGPGEKFEFETTLGADA